MFFIDAKKKIDSSPHKEEMREGALLVPEPIPKPGAKKRGKRRNKD